MAVARWLLSGCKILGQKERPVLRADELSSYYSPSGQLMLRCDTRPGGLSTKSIAREPCCGRRLVLAKHVNLQHALTVHRFLIACMTYDHSSFRARYLPPTSALRPWFPRT